MTFMQDELKEELTTQLHPDVPKLKKCVTRWVRVYKDGTFGDIFPSESAASSHTAVWNADNCIAVVPVTIEWEEDV